MRFNINLPDPLYETIRKKAFNQRRSMSELIVDTLDTTFKDLPEKPQTKTVKSKEKKTAPIQPLDPLEDPDKFKSTNFCKHGRMKGLCEYGD